MDSRPGRVYSGGLLGPCPPGYFFFLSLLCPGALALLPFPFDGLDVGDVAPGVGVVGAGGAAGGDGGEGGGEGAGGGGGGGAGGGGGGLEPDWRERAWKPAAAGC